MDHVFKKRQQIEGPGKDKRLLKTHMVIAGSEEDGDQISRKMRLDLKVKGV